MHRDLPAALVDLLTLSGTATVETCRQTRR